MAAHTESPREMSFVPVLVLSCIYLCVSVLSCGFPISVAGENSIIYRPHLGGCGAVKWTEGQEKKKETEKTGNNK